MKVEGTGAAEILAAAAALFESEGPTRPRQRVRLLSPWDSAKPRFFTISPGKRTFSANFSTRRYDPHLNSRRRYSLGSLDADAALWLLTREDVANLCRGPANLGALQLLPEVRSPQFAWFWRRRRQLFKEYMDHVAGIAAKVFAPGEPGTRTDLVFGRWKA